MADVRSEPVAVLASVIGWFYFICWCATFWPQPYVNWRRKKSKQTHTASPSTAAADSSIDESTPLPLLSRVSGLSMEFVAYQTTGFLCYSTYSVASYVLERQAAATDPTVLVSVQPNDIAFTLHALLLTLLVVWQSRRYAPRHPPSPKPLPPRISGLHFSILFAIWTIVFYTLILALSSSLPFYCIASDCAPYKLTFLSLLGLVKIAINLIKNIPQLLLNFHRRSTVGWPVTGVVLDTIGASAAFAQQCLDAWNGGGWGMVVGNVPKLMLSVLSFSFDVTFLIQHFICYRQRAGSKPEPEEEEEDDDWEGGLDGGKGSLQDWQASNGTAAHAEGGTAVDDAAAAAGGGAVEGTEGAAEGGEGESWKVKKKRVGSVSYAEYLLFEDSPVAINSARGFSTPSQA